MFPIYVMIKTWDILISLFLDLKSYKFNDWNRKEKNIAATVSVTMET